MFPAQSSRPLGSVLLLDGVLKGADQGIRSWLKEDRECGCVCLLQKCLQFGGKSLGLPVIRGPSSPVTFGLLGPGAHWSGAQDPTRYHEEEETEVVARMIREVLAGDACAGP